MRFVRPHLSLVDSYLGFLDELRSVGDTVWPGRSPQEDESPEDFVHRLRKQEHAPTVSPVPHVVWWAAGADDNVLGVVVLRLRLTPALQLYGGHVSYEVRPSQRRRGVGTAMLAALLATPEARTIGRLRITCAESHTASRRIIEANDGRLVRTVFSEEAQRPTCLYDVPVPP